MKYSLRHLLVKNMAFLIVSCSFFLFISHAKAAEPNWQNLVIDGDNAIQLQRLVEAEDSYKEALKKIKHQNHTDDDTAKCLEKLASTLALEDKAEESMRIYYKALQLIEKTHGKNSPKTVPLLFALGSIYEAEGDFKNAMNLYQKALDINEKNYGPFSPAVADNLHRLGRVHLSAGENKEAENSYKSSLAILMEQPSLADSKQLESLLNDYGDLLRKNDNSSNNLISDFQKEVLQDRPNFPVPTAGVSPSAWQREINNQTTTSFKRQSDEEEKVLLRGFKQPFSDETLKPAYKALADALTLQQRHKESEENYERMIAIDIKALGSNHPSVADDLTNLALLYISENRYAEAKPLLIRALSIYQSVYGDDNLLVLRTKGCLATVYSKLGDTKEALAMYNDTIAKGNIAAEPSNLDTARLLNGLAYLYYSQGRLEDARTVYGWALASTKAAVGEHNILVAACLTDYANVMHRLGLNAQADELDHQAKMIKLICSDDNREQRHD